MSRVRDNLFTKVSSIEEGGGSGGGESTTITDAENVIISDTEPETPTASTIWLDTTNDENLLKIYDGEQWIVVSGAWA